MCNAVALSPVVIGFVLPKLTADTPIGWARAPAPLTIPLYVGISGVFFLAALVRAGHFNPRHPDGRRSDQGKRVAKPSLLRRHSGQPDRLARTHLPRTLRRIVDFCLANLALRAFRKRMAARRSTSGHGPITDGGRPRATSEFDSNALTNMNYFGRTAASQGLGRKICLLRIRALCATVFQKQTRTPMNRPLLRCHAGSLHSIC
jgi:hypothetical protein